MVSLHMSCNNRKGTLRVGAWILNCSKSAASYAS
jgi:hypothetical protein